VNFLSSIWGSNFSYVQNFMLSPHSAGNRRASVLLCNVNLFVADVSAHYLTHSRGQEVEDCW
jgi:hypothetical protein